MLNLIECMGSCVHSRVVWFRKTVSVGVAKVEKRLQIFSTEEVGIRSVVNLSAYSVSILGIQITALFWAFPDFF